MNQTLSDNPIASKTIRKPRSRRCRAALLIVIFISGAVVGAAATVIYQPNHGRRGRKSMDDIRDRVTKQIASGLDLSDEQTEQVRGIMAERLVMRRKIRRKILPEMKEQAAALNGKVDAILTDEQRVKWEQFYPELYDRWFARPETPKPSDEKK